MFVCVDECWQRCCQRRSWHRCGSSTNCADHFRPVAYSHTTMSTPSDPQAAALLAHVVSQMKSNVDFLVSQNYISQSDASAIVSRLPPVAGINQLTPQIQGISVEAPEAPVRRGIPAPPVRKLQARALWAYNMDGQVCNTTTTTWISIDQGWWNSNQKISHFPPEIS